MEGNLRSLRLADLERARDDSDYREHFLRREIPRELVLRKLASGKHLPAEVRAHYEALLQGAPEGVEVAPALDLHKAWHGIHFLLTGEAWGGPAPLAHAVLPRQDQTLGPDQGYLLPAQVRDVAAALSALGVEELRRRYDPVKMTELEIHPSVIWLREDEDNFDWLMQFYQPLPAYYENAANAGGAMLVWIS